MRKVSFWAGTALLSMMMASCSFGSSQHSFGAYSEAEALYRQGDFVRSTEKYQEYLAANPQGNLAATAEYAIAKNYKALGDTAKARESFKQVAKKYPGTSWAAFAQDQLETASGTSQA